VQQHVQQPANQPPIPSDRHQLAAGRNADT
jgi:hypothetical protein